MKGRSWEGGPVGVYLMTFSIGQQGSIPACVSLCVFVCPSAENPRLACRRLGQLAALHSTPAAATCVSGCPPRQNGGDA